MENNRKTRILICGVLPPPIFGHSAMYSMLMNSGFPEAQDIRFLNLNFWSYETHKKVTAAKLGKLVKYFSRYVVLLLSFRPQFVFYNISFYKMPFYKDFLFCLTARILGSRPVLHDHGQYAGELFQTGGPVIRFLMRQLFRFLAASVIMGESTRQSYQGLLDQQRLFVVPGAVEDTAGIEARREKGDTVRVLFFSHMSHLKGIDVALAAAAEVLASTPGVGFTFAGPMEDPDIEQRLAALRDRFPGRLDYRGYVGDEVERVRLFRSADIFIFPTLRDVFGLVILQAMAEGLPVIASVEGTIPEILEEGRNGYLVPKGDARCLAQRIRQLAASPAERARMGRENRMRYERHYTPRHYAQNLNAVFARLAGQRIKMQAGVDD